MYWYTGTLRAHSQGTSGQVREEDAASVYGYTGTLLANSEGRVARPCRLGLFVQEEYRVVAGGLPPRHTVPSK